MRPAVEKKQPRLRRTLQQQYFTQRYWHYKICLGVYAFTYFRSA